MELGELYMKTINYGQTCALPSRLLDLFAEVIQKGKITLDDRYTLKTEILNAPLTEDEKDSINRLVYSVKRGLLEVVE